MRTFVKLAAVLVAVAVGRVDARDGTTGAEGGRPDLPPRVTGSVMETIDAGRYTYVRLDTGEQELWAAAPKSKVAVGDRISLSTGLPMKDFKSTSLKRSFDWVYFTDRFRPEGEGAASGARLPPGHPPVKVDRDDPAKKLDYSDLKKPTGAKTVAEVYGQTATLAGKKVTVLGKAVKVNLEIMERNWIHLRDGTGKAGSNDLLVTSTNVVKPGDTILVHGVVATNRSFGHGYSYPVLVENAAVTIK